MRISLQFHDQKNLLSWPPLTDADAVMCGLGMDFEMNRMIDIGKNEATETMILMMPVLMMNTRA